MGLEFTPHSAGHTVPSVEGVPFSKLHKGNFWDSYVSAGLSHSHSLPPSLVDSPASPTLSPSSSPSYVLPSINPFSSILELGVSLESLKACFMALRPFFGGRGLLVSFPLVECNFQSTSNLMA